MWKAEERIRSLAYTGSEDDLVEKMNKLGPEEYLNCFLVTKGVRDGYLYQMVDHNEYDVNAPISKKKLKLMKKYFPSLHQTKNGQGVLLSTKAFPLHEIEDKSSLGKILGYPCAFYPDEISTKSTADEINAWLTANGIPHRTSIQINITISLGNEDVEDKEYNLIGFLCLEFERHQKEIEELVSKIKKALHSDSHMKKMIKNVELDVETIIDQDNLIRALSNYTQALSGSEKSSMMNFLYNMGVYTPEFESLVQTIGTEIDYENPLHRGILIGLLTYSKSPPDSAFFPIQNYGGQAKVNEVAEINTQWFKSIFEAIKQTSKRSVLSKLKGLFVG